MEALEAKVGLEAKEGPGMETGKQGRFSVGPFGFFFFWFFFSSRSR